MVIIAIINEINNTIYNADYIYFLPTFEGSKGSDLELHLCKYYEKKIIFLKTSDLIDNSLIKKFENKFEVRFDNRMQHNIKYKHFFIYVIKKLFQSNYQDLADTLNITRSTVINAFTNTSYYLKNNSLQINEYKKIEKEVIEFFRNC
jgi:hypothetical protein